ncbi:XRE family transcriptional regulator [Paraburkholderia youngii]|uniref:XRE family transcriptional regulator n=1 Tax=Paraburkholderia youngii TaxID=2782701 RepID=UPI003D24DFC0
MPIEFDEPSTEDLTDLKRRRNATGKEMADIFWLGGDHQFRKYTGGKEPRKMSFHVAFVGAAQMALPPEMFNLVLQEMATFGARARRVEGKVAPSETAGEEEG